MLEIIDAVKSFKGINVISNLSLKVAQNSIVGLAGASGSGKSTLLRCIQGLEPLHSGRIISKGVAGFIFQDFQLFPHMTVWENVIYAPQRVLRQPAALAREIASSLLHQLGLQDKRDAYPTELSGGQKQRVALARACAMGPDLLLCDEPTSGLDEGSIQDVVHLLKKVRAMGVSMIIASHDLDFLTHIADRILVLKEGRIMKDMNGVADAFSAEVLKEVFR